MPMASLTAFGSVVGDTCTFMGGVAATGAGVPEVVLLPS